MNSSPEHIQTLQFMLYTICGLAITCFVAVAVGAFYSEVRRGNDDCTR